MYAYALHWPKCIICVLFKSVPNVYLHNRKTQLRIVSHVARFFQQKFHDETDSLTINSGTCQS